MGDGVQTVQSMFVDRGVDRFVQIQFQRRGRIVGRGRGRGWSRDDRHRCGSAGRFGFVRGRTGLGGVTIVALVETIVIAVVVRSRGEGEGSFRARDC